MAAEHSSIDALSQFRLSTVFGEVGSSVGFTQSNLFMLVAGILVVALMVVGMTRRAVIPGRLQGMAEASYEFIQGMAIGQIGPEGKKFFPFLFTLFMFILVGNLLGLLPFFFTFTSHIAVTFALAVIVILLVTGVALYIHGFRFFTYFFPAGAPIWLAPIIIPIEIISYLSRPVSLSIRLFANMVAGHVMLTVFASFVVMLLGAGGVLAATFVFPVAINVVLFGFELLVAFLQAYVFAILTSIYLHDAVHLH